MALRQLLDNARGYGLHLDFLGRFVSRVEQKPLEKCHMVFVPSVKSSRSKQVQSDALMNVCIVMLMDMDDMRSRLALWKPPKHASKLSEAWSGPQSHLHQPCTTQNRHHHLYPALL